MAVNVMVDETTGRVVEPEERWSSVDHVYLLSREDASNLRKAAGSKSLKDRIAHWKKLEPLFQPPQLWDQVLAHIEGMEG